MSGQPDSRADAPEKQAAIRPPPRPHAARPTPGTDAAPPTGTMTYEQFLAWADEDTLAEWVNGEVVMYSPVGDRHQDVCGFLEAVLRIFTETRGLGAIRSGPFQMKLERSGREPDLMFVANEHLDRLRETYLDGPADLAVEIVSPDSAARDRGEKFYEYEASGVSEYWLIDPQRQQAELYQLGPDGHYHLAAADDQGRYHASVLPGFWLRPDWLWQQPLPPAVRVVAEIAGVDPSVTRAFEQGLAGP